MGGKNRKTSELKPKTLTTNFLLLKTKHLNKTSHLGYVNFLNKLHLKYN